MIDDKTDPQQRRVYLLERLELRGLRRHKLPLKLMRRWAKGACDFYGVPQVKIRVWRQKGFGGSYLNDRIQLDPDVGRNGLLLAHELAHHITGHLCPRAQDHGANFMYFYGALLHGWRMVPFAGFTAVCQKHAVRVARTRPGAMREPVGRTPAGRAKPSTL